MRAAAFPPPLGPGDRVGVAALSGPVDPARLDAGLAALAGLGFEPVEAANLRRRDGLFAGSDAERLDGFHRLAADDSIAAVVFARGGHGALRVLPGIDWALLARRPRAYVGYSDLTPFLLAVVHRLRLVAFHGPMVAADFARGLDAAEQASFLDLLGGRLPVRYRLDATSGAAVSGVLLGGCLSLLVAALGTPWAPRLRGALLFVEEVDEPLYRFDRMLTHLRLSGTLTGIRGIIAGHLAGVGGGPAERRARRHSEEDGGIEGDTEGAGTRRDAVARALLETSTSATIPLVTAPLGTAPLGTVPLATGLQAGHLAPNLTLPLGARARLDPAAGTLDVGLRASRR